MKHRHTSSSVVSSRWLRRGLVALGALGFALAGSRAEAANFSNADLAWKAVPQQGAGFADSLVDGQGNGREIVGTTASPAVFFATDATHFFVRLRIDDTPLNNQNEFKQFGWGILIDTDGNLASYELSLMVAASGNPQTIDYAENTTKTGSAKDLAETGLAAEPIDYTAGTGNVRVTAANTTLNGTQDYFLDYAFPLALLAPKLTTSTKLVIWAGTSSSARRLDVDLAGVDDKTLTGAAAFAGGKSDPVTLDGSPFLDTDGDGVTDKDEAVLGTDSAKKDSDGDGIDDNVELSPTGSTTGPYSKIDTDGDGVIDARDTDSDNDCALDSSEKPTWRNASQPNASADANCTGSQTCNTLAGQCTVTCTSDANCPGAGRICATTTSLCVDGCRGGGTPKACATNFACSSTTSADGACTPVDTDGDGVSDVTEIALGSDHTKKDTDSDGIDDNVELSPTGSTTGPFTAIDTDADGVIDAKDVDADNDCVPDASEASTWRNASQPQAAADSNCSGGKRCDTTKGECTSSCTTDAQCGGTGRICEQSLCGDGCRGGASPVSCPAGKTCSSTTSAAGTCATPIADADGDGVPDAVETSLGTDPNNKDSDGDGIPDNVELSPTGSASGPFSAIDTDSDGRPDALDVDSDNDCVSDAQERGTWRDRSAPQASADANCGSGLTCDTARGSCVSSGGIAVGAAPTPGSLEGGGLSCAAAPDGTGGSLAVLGGLGLAVAATVRRRRGPRGHARRG